MNRVIVALTTAAAAGLAACAANDPYAVSAPRAAADASAVAAGGDTCFRLNQVRNHRVLDPHTMHLDVQGRGVFRLEMSGACLTAASQNDPIVTRSVSGSGLICRPIDLDLKIRTGHMLTPCIVNGMRQLSPQEVAALPPAQRP